jgi:hypothetical protein
MLDDHHLSMSPWACFFLNVLVSKFLEYFIRVAMALQNDHLFLLGTLKTNAFP